MIQSAWRNVDGYREGLVANRSSRSLCAFFLFFSTILATACGSDADSVDEEANSSTSTMISTSSSTAPSTTASNNTVPEEPPPETTTIVQSTTTSTVPPIPLPAQQSTLTASPAAWNRNGGFAVALHDVEGRGEIVAIDLATGSVDRVLATIDLEARWISRLQLNWDGTVVYYAVLVEDHWFSCESAAGHVMSLDLSTGVETVVGQGIDPWVSPDGSKLAYLAASQCVPDIFGDPENFVVTPFDSVVVRDLATGEERVWVHRELADTVALNDGADLIEAELRGLAWLGTDEIGLSNTRLSVSSLEPVRNAANLGGEVGGVQSLIGFHTASGRVLAAQQTYHEDGETGVRFVGVDPETGDVAYYPVSEGSNVALAFDAEHQNLLQLNGDRLVVDGRTVPLDVEIQNIDW